MRYALLGVALLLVGAALVGLWMHPTDWVVSVALASLLVALGLVLLGLVKSIPRSRDAGAVPVVIALLIVFAPIGFVSVYWLPSPFSGGGPSPLRLPTQAAPIATPTTSSAT